MAETIGARLERCARDKKGWTLRQFAGELGVSYETTRKWVVGSTAPNRNRVRQIVDLLGVTAEYVLFGDERPPAVVPPKGVFSISESEWEHLQDMRDMWDEDRNELKVQARALSAHFKAQRRQVLASIGIKGEADPKRVNMIAPAPAAPPGPNDVLVRVAPDSGHGELVDLPQQASLAPGGAQKRRIIVGRKTT